MSDENFYKNHPAEPRKTPILGISAEEAVEGRMIKRELDMA